jgi:hypothetical protein
MGLCKKDVSLKFDRSMPKGYISLKLDDGSTQKRCIPSLKVDGSNAKRKNPSCTGAQRKRAPNIICAYTCYWSTTTNSK